jgi:hypothetical protein
MRSGRSAPLLALLGFAGAAAAGAAGGTEADPIHEALLKGPASHSPARLELEVLELTPAHGMRTLGRFSAPVDGSRPARLRRRIEVPPVQIDLDVAVHSRWLNEARLWVEIDSTAAVAGSAASAARRQTSEALALGRSSLVEIFRIPGTARRLALAASWRRPEGEAPLPPTRASRPPAGGPMVDFLVELVRVEKGMEQMLRRQALRAVVGAEARSLLRLVQRQPGGTDQQQLDVRLTPRKLEGGILTMEVRIEGRLDADEDQSPLLVDHRDDASLQLGRGYSLPLGGAAGEGPSYRLDIRPRI